MSRASRTGGLRILVVNWLDRDNPKAGGAERHLHEVFGRLATCGHDVTVLVSGWRGCEARATTNGLSIHRTGRRYTFSLAAPRYYRRHLAGKGFDVVVEDLNKIPVFARYWCQAPLVVLVHHLFGVTAFQAAPFPVALVTWMLERPIPWVYRRAPVIAVSESTRQDLISRGLSPEGIEVVPNGIQLDLYTPAPDDARARRPTIVFVGRLKRYKRVDLVLEALPGVVDTGLDVELVVVGDGDERDSLEAHAQRLGVAQRVDFVGYVSEADKLEHLRRAWVHVLVSSKEGWGISIVEAAACGTPTVASDSPGLRESVVDGETGLLVPHGDVPALVDALRSLLTDSDRRRQMARAARRFAERFSWDASATAVEGVLRRVVAETGLD